MPGTIETDGPGAPERRLPGQHGPSPRHPTARPAGARRRWQHFIAAHSSPSLTAAVTVVMWAAAAVAWTLTTLRLDHRLGSGLGRDLGTVWYAERVFAHGGQPYSQAATHHRLYLYPPSSLLVLRPTALLSLHAALVLGLVATAALAWATVMVTSAAFGRRWWGLTSAVVVFALAFPQPMVAELTLENVTVMCALALAGCYLLVTRGHFDAAAILIGLSLAIKPMLLPVVLMFVIARKPRAFCLAIAVPLVLNGIAFAVVKNPNEVWSKLPSLLNRSGSGVQFNSAWVGVGHILGLPGLATILIQVATVALAVAGAWWSWQRLTDPATRFVTTTSVLLIGAFLAGTLSENHFMVVLVPLAMSAIVPEAPMRRVTAWIGVLLLMGLTPPGSLLGLDSEANLSVFRAFGMAVVLLTIVVVVGRRRSDASRMGLTMKSGTGQSSTLNGTFAG